jgi:hypothetical protein
MFHEVSPMSGGGDGMALRSPLPIPFELLIALGYNCLVRAAFAALAM